MQGIKVKNIMVFSTIVKNIFLDGSKARHDSD